MIDNPSLFDLTLPKYKITKPIRLIELFAGIGSQAKALKRLNANFEHYRVCEFDKFSMASYNAIHGTNFETSDVTKIDSEWLGIVDTDKYEYILTYSFPCSLAGYKVKTLNGYKNIEDIEVDELVLTHKNVYQKVLKTMNRKKKGYYNIKFLGGELDLTEEHPLYVHRDNKFQWVKVKDLKLTDKITFNINRKNVDCEIENDVLWLLGRYVADGHYNKYSYNSINFSINFEKEQEFINNIPKKFKEKFRKYKKNVYDYRIADKDFKNLCLQFNTESKNKKIPQWIIDLPKNKLQSFFDGYMSGDGYSRFKCGHEEKMFSTVSSNLFLSLQDIIIKLYGKVCSVYIRKDNRKETFNNSYNAQFILTNYNKNQYICDDKICVKIRNIKYKDEIVDVYNIEVENDNSYTLNNTIVHNCQDLSLAGKRAGMEKGSGTRSGLLWEVERLLKECHKGGQLPQILLMENVRQVITSKGWHEWCAFLESLGYSNYCEILNACDYEIPQHRERAFMISILGEYSYSFPKKNLLKLRLKDMLEKEVDEKYYLFKNNIQYILDMNDVALRSGRNINNSIVNPNIAKTISCRGATNQRADITNFVIDNLNREITVKELKSLLNKKDCKMSKHLKETLEKNDIEDGDYLDCYNRSIKKDGITGVIHTRISASNDTFVVVKDKIIIMGGEGDYP